MVRSPSKLSRRTFAGALAAAGGLAALGSGPRIAASTGPSGPTLQRAIPASGERLPVIGMGSWITFNVGNDQALRDQRVQVLQAFLDGGGGMIDS